MNKEQEDLAKSLSDFEAQNPDSFHDLAKESAAAQAAMKAAAATLKTADARSKLIQSMNNLTGQPGTSGNAAAAARVATAQENAVNSLDELKNAFANKDTTRQLQQAHELKDMLSQQARDLDKAASNPGSQSPGQAAQTAKAAGQAAGQLKDIVDHSNAGNAFGPQLHGRPLRCPAREAFQPACPGGEGAGCRFAEIRRAGCRKLASRHHEGV